MTMKNIINKTLILGAVFFIASCDKDDYDKDKYISKPQTYEDISLGVKTGVKLDGIGVELDPHFFSQNLTRNDGSKASDWEIVVRRVKAMQIHQFRVMLQPHWWEPVNDNDDPGIADLGRFTFDSEEMKSLYKVLDLAQENNIKVTLVLWGCPINMTLISGDYYHQKHFLCDNRPNPNWVCGTDKYEEFAENLSVVVQYLTENKGYTCVKSVTPFNEPDTHVAEYGRTMWQGDPLWEDQYAPMAKALDAKFKEDGIRDKIQFNLSDNTDGSPDYLKSCTEVLANEADLFNSHTYRFGYNTPNSEIFDWESQNVAWAKAAGKSHFVGEFGSNETVGASRQNDIDHYERGILMTRIVLNCLQAGASGVSYWSLLDQYYDRNDSYSQMQQLGLWKYVKEAYSPDAETYNSINEDYEVRPQYYAYSLLTRHIRPGSDVYPIDLGEEYAIGSAFEDEDGKWTYVFVNASEIRKMLAISNPDVSGSFDIYVYAEESLPDGDNLIEPGEIKEVKDGKLEITVKPNTIVLCRQK
jgi:alpha-galactosidase